MPPAPELRVRAVHQVALDPQGTHVLYWCIGARRTRWNFALQHAVHHARRLGLPLIVLEALRAGYRWASDRHHAFVLQGMADNARAYASTPVAFHPYVEPAPGAGRGLLEALARGAAVVVTDEVPGFFLPRMVEAAGARLGVRLEAVDGNGLYPLAAADRAFTVAHSFRRHLQKTLRPHLDAFPEPDPLRGLTLPQARVPEAVRARWPAADPALLAAEPAALAALPIDHGVAPVDRGGAVEGERRALDFVTRRLHRYALDRNDPDVDGTSGLSAHLHHGHVSAHQVVAELLRAEGWSPARLADHADGKRHGWWGLSEAAEGFLDELVTWRELGFQWCARHADFDRYESLPLWALDTLARHAADPRPWRHPLEVLDAAATHDPLWNAAQTQLKREGRIHNTLRMLWGKKVLHWSASPEAAWEALIELNNRYALDGRDPNSYSGISWCFGRFDRAWGPERPIFGTVRYMSSESARRKLSLGGYLERYGQRQRSLA